MSSGTEVSEEQVLAATCRVLSITPEQAREESAPGLNDLVSRSLMTGMLFAATQETPAVVLDTSDAQGSTDTTESAITATSTTPPARMLQHLLDCYSRVANEERTQPKVNFVIYIDK